jgi:hypothetical protein
MACGLSSAASQSENPQPRERSEQDYEQQGGSGLMKDVMGYCTIERSSGLPDDGRVEHRQHQTGGEAANPVSSITT